MRDPRKTENNRSLRTDQNPGGAIHRNAALPELCQTEVLGLLTVDGGDILLPNLKMPTSTQAAAVDRKRLQPLRRTPEQ